MKKKKKKIPKQTYGCGNRWEHAHASTSTFKEQERCTDSGGVMNTVTTIGGPCLLYDVPSFERTLIKVDEANSIYFFNQTPILGI